MWGFGGRRKKPDRGERREPGFDDPRGAALRAEPDDRISGGRKGSRAPGDRREPRLNTDGDLRADPREMSVGRKKGEDDRSGGRGKGSGRQRRKRRSRSLIGQFVYWVLVLGIWGAIGTAGVFGYYAAQLPPIDQLAVPKRPPNIAILGIDGEVL
ncbi:MAG: penicillin-binding protein, partial [Rhodoblastus sp.]|nr:penicillin-binding protein [Rhodoblastus sp.]